MIGCQLKEGNGQNRRQKYIERETTGEQIGQKNQHPTNPTPVAFRRFANLPDMQIPDELVLEKKSAAATGDGTTGGRSGGTGRNVFVFLRHVMNHGRPRIIHHPRNRFLEGENKDVF